MPETIRASSIVWKIAYDDDLVGIVGGEWDIGRRIKFASAPKPKSIFDHYRLGIPWEETELFEIYRVRLASGDKVRGCETQIQLVEQYERNMRWLLKNIRKTKPIPVLLGRDGEPMIGSQGNHRLAIAQLLEESLSCEVRCRYPR